MILLIHFDAGPTAINVKAHVLTAKSVCALSFIWEGPSLKWISDVTRVLSLSMDASPATSLDEQVTQQF